MSTADVLTADRISEALDVRFVTRAIVSDHSNGFDKINVCYTNFAAIFCRSMKTIVNVQSSVSNEISQGSLLGPRG